MDVRRGCGDGIHLFDEGHFGQGGSYWVEACGHCGKHFSMKLDVIAAAPSETGQVGAIAEKPKSGGEGS